MSLAVIKKKFDGRNAIGGITIADGRVPVLEGSDEHKKWIPMLEAAGCTVKEVPLPTGYYYYQNYNALLSGSSLEDLGLSEADYDPNNPELDTPVKVRKAKLELAARKEEKPVIKKKAAPKKRKVAPKKKTTTKT